MASTLESQSFYSEIVAHTTLNIMTKLTDYQSPEKQDAKIEAQRRNEEERVLYKNQISSDQIIKTSS